MSTANLPASVSIIVPAFNEAGAIAGVVAELQDFIKDRPMVEWEILVVNDCSTDATSDILAGMDGITVITHPQNRGYGAALKSGIRAAKGEWVLTFDSDGQHIAAEIDHLITDCHRFEAVIGIRPTNSSPLIRRPGKALLTWLTRHLMREQIPDVNSGMRLMRRDVILRYLTLCSNRFSFSLSSTMALTSEGHFVRYVKIATRPRQDNGSQVRMSTGLTALLMVFRITLVFHPLRIFLPLTALFGALWGLSLTYDLLNDNITDLSLLLLLVTCNAGLFGFMADQSSHVRRDLAKKDG